MGKLIACDLDGTLLPEGTFDLNPEYYDVIRRLHDAGNVFVAASGRHYTSMRLLLRPVFDDVVFLCGNGTFVACREVAMAVHALPRDLTEAVIRDMRTYGGQICADTTDAVWTESRDDSFCKWMSGGYRMNMRRTDDLLCIGPDGTVSRDGQAGGGSQSEEACLPQEPARSDAGSGILKCALFVDRDAQAIADTLAAKYGDRVHIMSAGRQWVDCVPLSVDKGTALSDLQKRLGFSREDTIAFGDNGNDVGMLRCAGESYCVGGGREEAKKAAGHVIGGYEEDAVLEVLKKLL